ncbi:hypothetical protein L7F22_031799 [Adiantum nelumboides]|nr:hypothetical protein [Adiantum nelumboides]
MPRTRSSSAGMRRSRQHPQSIPPQRKRGRGMATPPRRSRSKRVPSLQSTGKGGLASSLHNMLLRSSRCLPCPKRSKSRSSERASKRKFCSSLKESTSNSIACNADVLRHICKFLGLIDVLKCRLVCKLWHLSLKDVDHIRHTFCCLTQLPSENHVFLLRPEVVDMHVCPRPAATNASPCWKHSLHLRRPWYSQWAVAASAHGLLCVQSASTFLVCNPVTGTHKILPQLSFIKNVESVGMHYNLLRKSYIILVIGVNRSSSKTYFHDNKDPVKQPYYVSHVEIYNSQVGFWEHHSHFIADTKVRKGNVAWWEDQFHLIVRKEGGLIQMLAYDMAQKQWIDCEVEAPEKEFRPPSLFVWDGTLVCRIEGFYGFGDVYWKLDHWTTSLVRREQLPGIESRVEANFAPHKFCTDVSKCDKRAWKPLHLQSEKGNALHVAIHKTSTWDELVVCMFDPYAFTPRETSVTSSQHDIILCKRQISVPCFAFTPCHSAKV